MSNKEKLECVMPMMQGKVLVQTKDKTHVLLLSGTWKVVMSPINPFETTVNTEVHVPKEIIPEGFRKFLLELWNQNFEGEEI